jgi:hypothetical protein
MSDMDEPPDLLPDECSDEENLTMAAQAIVLRPPELQQDLVNLLSQNGLPHGDNDPGNGPAGDEYDDDDDDDDENGDYDYESDDDGEDHPQIAEVAGQLANAIRAGDPTEDEDYDDEDAPPPLAECNSSEEDDDDNQAGSRPPQPPQMKQDAEKFRADGNRLFNQSKFKEVHPSTCLQRSTQGCFLRRCVMKFLRRLIANHDMRSERKAHLLHVLQTVGKFALCQSDLASPHSICSCIRNLRMPQKSATKILSPVQNNTFFPCGQAVEFYSKGIAIDSTDPRLYTNRATCYEKMGVRFCCTLYKTQNACMCPRWRNNTRTDVLLLRKQDWNNALEDAKKSIECDRNWTKVNLLLSRWPFRVKACTVE